VKTLIFYFDFISPYAYLAAEGIEALAKRNGCEVTWRPVLLAALLDRNKQLGPAEIPDKRTYTFKHIARLAYDLDLPLQTPPGHPFNSLLPLRIACLRPEGELILHLFRACWKDGRAIDSEEALSSLMDEDTLRRATTKEAKQKLKDSTQEAIEAGVFGVPSINVEGEIFWGLDSFHHLERYLAGQDPLDQALLTKWESLPASASRVQAN
jgi:2-hydroxychromene-2-carboxylate isomerase